MFIFRLIICYCIVYLSVDCAAQSPYDFTTEVDAPLIGIGAIGLGTSIWLINKDKPMTEQDILSLNLENLSSANAWSVGQSSKSARKISDVLLRSSFLTPFAFLAGKKSRDTFGSVGLLALESLLINTAMTNTTKAVVQRPRPYLYRDDYKTYEWHSKNSSWSFYSGHTSSVAVMYFVSAQMFSDYYPDSSWKPVVWTTAAVVPAITGYLRMKGGRHFFTDVLIGYVAGAAIGILVPNLH